MFAERATALLLPPGRTLTVRADTLLEAILISAPSPDGGTAVLVRAEDVQPATRGRDTFTREVHNVFVTDTHAKRLLVGETFNPPGNWSSYPPHKHDGRDGEPVLEEVYHYRIDPPQGFGVQMLYGATASRSRTPCATAMRCCCRTATTRCRRRPATVSTTSGAWRAPSAVSRCTKIPLTVGSTSNK